MCMWQEVFQKKSEAGQECEKIIIKIPSAIEKKRLEIELFKRFNFFESFGVFQISRLFLREKLVLVASKTWNWETVALLYSSVEPMGDGDYVMAVGPLVKVSFS